MDREDKGKDYVYMTADPTLYKRLKQYAEENKMFMTEAESALWQMIKGNSIGHTFRRQHIIGDYIADFANLHFKLIVEVDGKYHFKGEQPIADDIRTADLNRMGWTVVRFTNEEVLGNPRKVLFQLKDVIHKMEVFYADNIKSSENKKEKAQSQTKIIPPSPFGEGKGERPAQLAWAVDAACSGNPGPMEYRCIDLQTGEQIFHFGPMQGTNNIGEFLAIVHALALLDKKGMKDYAIYSDSYNAILWVNKRHCKTTLTRDASTEDLYQIIGRAEEWLKTHRFSTPIIKWETKKWGEIPADFGRK